MTHPDEQASSTSAAPSTAAAQTLQRLVHVFGYALGCEAWLKVGLIVLLQWFVMDEGHWQGLPDGSQKIVYEMVIYSTVFDVAMNYAVDRLACVQSLIRFFVMFGIVALFPAVQTLKIVYPCMLLVWSVNNLIAYAYGASQAFFANPKDISPALTNARYSWFRVLFPLSVMLEVLMAYLAMPIAKEWNKSYSLVMVLGAFAYIPAFPSLFRNKLIERRRYVQRLFLEKNK